MKWIGGQTLYNDLRLISGDLAIYKAVNDGNPTISLGSSTTERLEIKAEYESGAQGLDVVRFTSFTAGSSADDARYAFEVDDVFLFGIVDDGVRIKASGFLEIGSGNAILSDSGGTTTLSNIDALDATTIATFETAMEANLDTFGSQMTSASSLATVGTITTGVWNGTSISTTYTDAKVTSIVAGDGIDVSGATGDVTVTAETATDSNPGVVELATTAEAVTGTDTARAVTPAGLTARVSQIINLKGYVTLQNDVYDYANPFNSDDEAPFQIGTDYGSGTIGSSTEKTQASFMRSGGFHVPFACTVSALQVQASVNGSGGGNVTAALVEYRPSTASGDQNDYPRTVYEEVNVAANNNNNKIATTTIAAGDLDATAVPAGSHLMIMVKGDSDTVGDLAIVSMSVGLSW